MMNAKKILYKIKQVLIKDHIEYHLAFRCMDIDKDGKISFKDFKYSFEQMNRNNALLD